MKRQYIYSRLHVGAARYATSDGWENNKAAIDDGPTWSRKVGSFRITYRGREIGISITSQSSHPPLIPACGVRICWVGIEGGCWLGQAPIHRPVSDSGSAWLRIDQLRHNTLHASTGDSDQDKSYSVPFWFIYLTCSNSYWWSFQLFLFPFSWPKNRTKWYNFSFYFCQAISVFTCIRYLVSAVSMVNRWLACCVTGLMVLFLYSQESILLLYSCIPKPSQVKPRRLLHCSLPHESLFLATVSDHKTLFIPVTNSTLSQKHCSHTHYEQCSPVTKYSLPRVAGYATVARTRSYSKHFSFPLLHKCYCIALFFSPPSKKKKNSKPVRTHGDLLVRIVYVLAVLPCRIG